MVLPNIVTVVVHLAKCGKVRFLDSCLCFPFCFSSSAASQDQVERNSWACLFFCTITSSTLGSGELEEEDEWSYYPNEQ